MMRRNMMLFISLTVIFMLGVSISTAYTSTGGIEKDDEVDMHYLLTVDGTVKEENKQFVTKVSPNNLIQGFYEGLLGMKEGEEKQIIVPPEKGYSTGELAGKTLYFDVSINRIVKNVRGDDASGSGSGVGSFIKKAGITILSVGGLYVAWLLYQSFQRVSVPKCEHCASIGQKTRSDGFCKTCGKNYCRDSYSRGCPSCKGNTLLPLKN